MICSGRGHVEGDGEYGVMEEDELATEQFATSASSTEDTEELSPRRRYVTRDVL